VLRHLAAGCTTEQISELMGIEIHTVRNHVRDLLRRLRVHSRLEAVVRAQELGLTAG
jgi:DNA-binding CsgD family transcriptional regulator